MVFSSVCNDALATRRLKISACSAKTFVCVGEIGKMTWEGDGCGDDDGREDDGGCDATVDVDAEKDDGDAYGRDSVDKRECTGGDGTVGDDRFVPD